MASSSHRHHPANCMNNLVARFSGLLVLLFTFSGWAQQTPEVVQPEVRLKRYTQTHSYFSGYSYDVDWYGFAYSGSGNWNGWHNINWNTTTGGYERYGGSYSGIWTYPDWGSYTWGGYYAANTTWPAPPALGTMVYTNSWHWTYPDGSGGTTAYGDTNTVTYPEIPQPGGFPWRFAQTYRYEPYNYSDADPDGGWSWSYDSPV